MTKNNQEKGLSRIVLREGIKSAIYILGFPTILVLTERLKGANIDEIIKNPHVMLSGVYFYAGSKALDLVSRAKRFVQEKIYSPEILNLESQLRTASIKGRTEDFEGLVNNLYKAFEQRGKDGKEKIKKKHKNAYWRAFRVTFGELKEAIKEGNPKMLEKECDKYESIIASYQRAFGSTKELTWRTNISFSELQRKCSWVYVNKKIDDLEAQLDGYHDNEERKIAKKVSRDSLLGILATSFMRRPCPDYEAMKGEINRLKEISFNLGLGESKKLRRFEDEFYVVKLLNTKLSELYDFAEQTGDLQAVKQRFEAIKPLLTRYKNSTIDEAYERILRVVSETQIENDRRERGYHGYYVSQ